MRGQMPGRFTRPILTPARCPSLVRRLGPELTDENRRTLRRPRADLGARPERFSFIHGDLIRNGPLSHGGGLSNVGFAPSGPQPGVPDCSPSVEDLRASEVDVARSCWGGAQGFWRCRLQLRGQRLLPESACCRCPLIIAQGPLRGHA